MFRGCAACEIPPYGVPDPPRGGGELLRRRQRQRRAPVRGLPVRPRLRLGAHARRGGPGHGAGSVVLGTDFVYSGSAARICVTYEFRFRGWAQRWAECGIPSPCVPTQRGARPGDQDLCRRTHRCARAGPAARSPAASAELQTGNLGDTKSDRNRDLSNYEIGCFQLRNRALSKYKIGFFFCFFCNHI